MRGNFENEIQKRRGVSSQISMTSWEICDAYGFHYFNLTINWFQPDMWYSIIKIMTCEI